MPAIRVLYGSVTPQYNHTDLGLVEVKRSDGDFAVIKFLGFICDRGRAAVPGNWGKIAALGVCAGNRMEEKEWIKVGPDRYVVGWRATVLDTPPRTIGIYAVVDSAGMPVVIDEPGFVTPKVYIKAPVVTLSDKSVR